MIGPDTQKELASEKAKNPIVNFDRNGTYLIGWEASPSYIEIQPDIFNKYIESEGYKNVIQLRSEKGKQQSPGREKYDRFLKCVIQVGTERTADYWKNSWAKNRTHSVGQSRIPLKPVQKFLYGSFIVRSTGSRRASDGHSRIHSARNTMCMHIR